MLTQINCPNCGTTYPTEVHQVIDVGRNPELKTALLSGQLNVATCPSCGTGGQLSTAMVYHDPQHELFMIYVPQELDLDQLQREQYIGQLTRDVMDATPAEQRRAYMLQPITMLTMQGFLEKVLETEGVTKEMIERQQKQAELLNTLLGADQDVVDHLVKERAGEIDEVFFAMLRQYIEAASQMNDDQQMVPMINLQAKLMTDTKVGRKLERQQIALHGLNRAAKEAGGLTAAVLLNQILKNQEDAELVSLLAQAGMQAMTYDFFTGLTEEIERLELAGDVAAAERLSTIRTDLLQLQEEVQTQTREMLAEAEETLESVLAADDMMQGLQANMNKINDAFMYVLSAEIGRAEEANDQERFEKLGSLRDLLTSDPEGQAPPEIQLLNQLVRAESEDEMRQLVEENREMVSPDLVAVIEALQEQAGTTGQQELIDRLDRVKIVLLDEID